jgi:predicted RNA-binding Zn ribbon-like protein
MLPVSEPPVSGFRFRGGRLSLDYVATLAGRHRGGVEQLNRPEDLGRWFVSAGVVAEWFPARQADLVPARQLREAVHRLVHPATRNNPAATDVDILNQWAGFSGPRPVLGSDARSTVLVAEHPLRACLSAVATDAIELVVGPELSFVRECARVDCSVLFIDNSRTRQRRWCDMTLCGNRAKAARHRRLRRSAVSRT